MKKDIAEGSSAGKSSARKFHGKLPTKRTVNLAVIGRKKSNFALAVPGILIIVLLAALFSKFAVVDRFNQVYRAQAEVRSLQNRVDEGYRKIESFGDLQITYAHYTYSDMSTEELTLADRSDILDLLARCVLDRADVSAMNLKGNVLTISVTGITLSETNAIVSNLEKDDMVNFCTVTTAATDTVADTDNDGHLEHVETNTSIVTAQIVVYLNDGEGRLIG